MIYGHYFIHIYLTLVYGGKLIILSYEKTRDTEDFYKLCSRELVTVLNQTPTAFYQFIDIVNTKNKLSVLRYIIFGGEALNIKQLDKWFEIYGYEYPKLINMYGITETTVHVTYKELGKEKADKSLHIGRKLLDLKTYILDTSLNIVPFGVIGELYVGGDGLARGYLGRSDLTAERFIANPYQSKEDREDKRYGEAGRNSRLYCTGDIVRYLAYGNLEYIGRNDNQVKIRGYRIELGEVESIISSFEGVEQNVVIARERQDILGEEVRSKYIVAYYVSKEKLDETILLNELSLKLPEYMMPIALIYLNKLPITLNGKLDRKALPDPEFLKTDQYVAPRNDIEAIICKVWSNVLEIEQEKIGINDNFFGLGGDSIIAIRLVSKLNKEFNSSIKVRDIFELQNINNLAKKYNHYSSLEEVLKKRGKRYEF